MATGATVSQGDSLFFGGKYASASANEEQRLARQLYEHEQRVSKKAKTPVASSVAAAASAAALEHTTLSRDKLPNRDDLEIQLQEHAFETREAKLPQTILTEAEIEQRERNLRQHITSQLRQQRFLSQYKHTIEKLSVSRVCTRCHADFALIESIGRWQCRTHIGQVNRDTFKWSCCGKPFLPLVEGSLRPVPVSGLGNACTPVDHTDLPIHEHGVADGLGCWRVPLELEVIFTQGFWSTFGDNTDLPERLQVTWDARDERDPHSDELGDTDGSGAREADESDEDGDDDDDRNRSKYELAVRSGRWTSATRNNEISLLAGSRYSIHKNDAASAGMLSSSHSRYAYARGAAVPVKYFFVPTSPRINGPSKLVASSPDFRLTERIPVVEQKRKRPASV